MKERKLCEGTFVYTVERMGIKGLRKGKWPAARECQLKDAQVRATCAKGGAQVTLTNTVPPGGLAGKHESVKCILFGEGAGDQQNLRIKSHGFRSLGEKRSVHILQAKGQVSCTKERKWPKTKQRRWRCQAHVCQKSFFKKSFFKISYPSHSLDT